MIKSRTCVGCRQQGIRQDLIRIVLVSGKPILDQSKSMSGRGAWLHKELKCLDLAVDRGSFPRAFRSKINVADLAKFKEQVRKDVGQIMSTSK